MEIKPKYREYYKQIWKKTEKDIRDYLARDWKGWVGGIITAVIASIISLLLKVDDIMPNIIVIIISSVGGAVTWLIFLIVYHWITSHAKLYREKEIDADIQTWNGITISDYNPEPDSILGIGLKITSDKPFDTIIDRPILESIHKGRKLLPELGSKKIELPFFRETGNRFRSSIRVNRNLSEIVGIGTWDNKEAELFTEGQAEKVFFESNTEYKITVRFYGETNRCKLPIRKISAMIIYKDRKLIINKTNDQILSIYPPLKH